MNTEIKFRKDYKQSVVYSNNKTGIFSFSLKNISKGTVLFQKEVCGVVFLLSFFLLKNGSLYKLMK